MPASGNGIKFLGSVLLFLAIQIPIWAPRYCGRLLKGRR
jgi:hypothetical protein